MTDSPSGGARRVSLLERAARATVSVRRRLPAPAKRALRATRRRLPSSIADSLAVPAGSPPTGPLPSRPPVADAEVRLLVAPANFAGQGHQWAQAVQRYVPAVTAQSFAVLNGRYDFPVDYAVDRTVYASLAWQRDQERYVARTFTHLLIEAERPVFGGLYGPECSTEIPVLHRAGLVVGLIAHGSDVRVPTLHAERYEWSPFRESDWDIIPTLEYNARRNAQVLRDYAGSVLVSTPDLLDDVPNASWCPVVVDVGFWATQAPVMERKRPVVVHAPSKARMKGSELIDPIVVDLADSGVVDYRRVEGVSPDEMPDVYRTADIVLDQFRLGSYGVAACEGMAAGRVVVGHVAEEIRERVRSVSGIDCAIVEATPATLRDVLLRLVEDRTTARECARAGAAYVRSVHDGRLAADALTPFLAQEPGR